MVPKVHSASAMAAPTAPWLPVKMCSRKPMMRACTVLVIEESYL